MAFRFSRELIVPIAANIESQISQIIFLGPQAECKHGGMKFATGYAFQNIRLLT